LPGGMAATPLLPGEDAAEYETLSARILAAIKPSDFIEELLVRDAIDLTWDGLRLRRMRAGLLRSAVGRGVRKILSIIGYSDFRGNERFAEEWASGKASARLEFEKLLKKAGLTMDDAIAEAHASEIGAIERLDRMLASAEARRTNALREIDRHRSVLGAAMRQMIDEVEDVEFRDVETGTVTLGSSP
jgi:hypothetical protein